MRLQETIGAYVVSTVRLPDCPVYETVMFPVINSNSNTIYFFTLHCERSSSEDEAREAHVRGRAFAEELRRGDQERQQT